MSAPLTELRYHKALSRYERVKLGLMIAVLLVVLVSGWYLIALSRADHQSLVILKCAVNHSTSFDSHGHLRSQEEARRVFDACVARG